MKGSVRRWAGWLLAAGIVSSLGLLLAMAVAASPAPTCCPEPCQWVLSAPCCDLSAATQAAPASPPAPALADRWRDAQTPGPIARCGRSPAPVYAISVASGLRTTVLRL